MGMSSVVYPKAYTGVQEDSLLYCRQHRNYSSYFPEVIIFLLVVLPFNIFSLIKNS